MDVIVFKAMGRAINKTVMIVELMKVPHTFVTNLLFLIFVWYYILVIVNKQVDAIIQLIILHILQRRIVGLHQITNIASTDITDTWEPLEEGLLP